MSDKKPTAVNYVREAIAAHMDADQYEIARLTASAIPAKDRVTILAEALVHIAREEMGRSRRESLDNALSNSSTKDSAKLRDRANWWNTMLAQRVNVNGESKLLGDCTLNDLYACIEARENLIAQISGQIDHYKRLQKLMEQYGAETVSDIPPQSEWKDAA